MQRGGGGKGTELYRENSQLEIEPEEGKTGVNAKYNSYNCHK